MKIKVFKTDKKSSSVKAPKELELDRLNKDLIAQVYRIEQINRKQPVQTKTRSERAGGGAKPWPQKGTGRARHGSIRSPLWRKGGVVFGPRKDQLGKKRINKKMKKQAINNLLYSLIKDNDLILIDEIPNLKKTKKWEAFIAQMPIEDPGRMLLVSTNKEMKKTKFAQNLPYLKIADMKGLNTTNLLNTDQLLISKAAWQKYLKNFKKTDNK